ncbi:hypothetical protein E8E14_010035 [Neopestalotiopsis sp. 37M]|nr:hypothetical protein E8E14_010035 [Neopestalotiopsis sp. 37M]
MDIPFAIRPDVLREGVLWHKLWQYLYLTRESLATDPRDKLFALKAFLEPPETDEAVPFLADFDDLIDYEKCLEVILLKVALTLLQFVGLRLLVGARHGHNRRLPSWVPDWSQNTALNWAFFWFSGHDEEDIRALIQDNFEKYQTQDPRFLNVRGWSYGQIHEMGKTYDFDNLEDAEQQMSHVVTIITAACSSGSTQPEASEIMEAGLSRNILDVLHQMDTEEIAALLTRNFELTVSVDEFRPGKRRYAEHMKDMMSALQDCRLAFCGAQCIAIVPRSAVEGDVLVVVEGASAPCLIRPSSDGTWYLISGDCYAQFMDEWTPFNKGDSWEDTTYDLRKHLGEPVGFRLS